MKGIIATGNKRTAAIGAEILAAGGNAADAVIAASFAACVAEMVVANIGGAGFATVVDSHDGTRDARCYDFFSSMPSRPTSEDADFRCIHADFGSETQAFHIGRASTALPGLVAGLCRLAHEKGRLPLARLIEPAIQLAESGYEIDAFGALVLKVLRPIYEDTPEIRALVQKGGASVQVGDPIRLPHLAASLREIGETEGESFYRGRLAAAIAADQHQHGGLITAEDLAGYTVAVQPPIAVPFRDFTVMLPPLASVGGVLVAFSLRLLAAVPAPTRFGDAGYLRTLTLVSALTNRARHAWGRRKDDGDQERIAWFLSDAHVKPAIEELRAILAGERRLGEDPVSPKGAPNTTHLSAMDADGMAVSLTFSAGEAAGYVVGDTGLVLNNMLGEEDLNPGGFHQQKPGTRLHSMMCPLVVLKDGKPVFAGGSAGSNRIRSAILQTLINALDLGLPLDAVINLPRGHFEDGVLHVEPGFDAAAIETMRAEGFQVKEWPEQNLYFGGAQAVCLRGDDFDGAGDQRRTGTVCKV
ncbi:gamma-glutamyltransferase family protein [Acanthopleuribacter pedis]|uniref:Gamma-glutamyltransferase n=1 Tax=Acanthopleuribacter pedis TaxID=442870 RepID=A0A8J7Q3P2_9BACT|nr:gamma-glutamyltransferase [Acanthopleuribacter pedis]MBO1317769.1 gamma-glutamyltransferase [Acanthopleuribacter pedis]